VRIQLVATFRTGLRAGCGEFSGRAARSHVDRLMDDAITAARREPEMLNHWRFFFLASNAAQALRTAAS